MYLRRKSALCIGGRSWTTWKLLGSRYLGTLPNVGVAQPKVGSSSAASSRETHRIKTESIVVIPLRRVLATRDVDVDGVHQKPLNVGALYRSFGTTFSTTEYIHHDTCT